MTRSKTALAEVNANANLDTPATERDGKSTGVDANASELESTIQPKSADGTEKSGIIVPVTVTLKYSDPNVVGA
jgi:hypothetical protein